MNELVPSALTLSHGIAVAALLLAYFVVDVAIRRGAVGACLRAVGLRGRVAEGVAWSAPLVALAATSDWATVAEGPLLRPLSLVLSGLITWKVATEDVDVGAGRARLFGRLGALACFAGTFVSPAFLIANLVVLTVAFNVWQHHATLPLRLLQLLAAHIVVAAVAPVASDASALVFAAVVMQASHYFITGLAKGLLGPKWYSWMLTNRVHHIMGSAYSWGWGRFLSWPTYRRLIRVVKAFERPMQVVVFAVEALAPLALLHPNAAIALSLAWAAFHLSVFATAGLLFWEWIAADIAIAVAIAIAPPAVTAVAFGPHALAIGVVLMFLFPLRHKLWKPMPLGWYDTPLTQRIHWRLHGESGAVYGMYNDFMCPHERLYGRVHGCFFVRRGVFTYHLGEVWKPELRDAIVATEGDPEKIEQVRERWGVDVRDDAMAAHHTAYLRRVFNRLNRGARKSVLPRWLRWLKAPGGQYFHAGDLPAYRRQEPVIRVELVYVEEYFDGDSIRRLRADKVADIDISEELDPGHDVCEIATKQLDDMLLSRANGVLVDLPSFGEGLVSGDDGRSAGAVPSAATP